MVGRVSGSCGNAAQMWTVGHSSHSLEHLHSLLDRHHIAAVADVRTQPFSSHAPHFCRQPLQDALESDGTGYMFLGAQLGGRPPEREMYDATGRVLYGSLARCSRFVSGLAELLDACSTQKVVVLCSEEDPTLCHRRLLVARAAVDACTDLVVTHLRGDGTARVDSAAALLAGQQSLFGTDDMWVSARPVRPPAP